MNETRTEVCRNCGHVHDIRDSEHSYREIMNEPQASLTPGIVERLREWEARKWPKRSLDDEERYGGLAALVEVKGKS